MKDRIGAIIIGKINGNIGTWINDIRDDRWSDLDYIEDRFDIVHFETDENIAISSISVRIQTPNKAIQPSNEDSIGSLYGLHQEADGYLYFIVYRESAFGCVF
jgi:hypothetical protein